MSDSTDQSVGIFCDSSEIFLRLSSCVSKENLVSYTSSKIYTHPVHQLKHTTHKINKDSKILRVLDVNLRGQFSGYLITKRNGTFHTVIGSNVCLLFILQYDPSRI